MFHRIQEQGNGIKLHQKSNATWPGGVPILGFQLQTTVVTILTLNKVHACKPVKDVEKKMWLLTSFSSLAALFYVSLIQNLGLHLRQAAFLTLSCICSALHLWVLVQAAQILGAVSMFLLNPSSPLSPTTHTHTHTVFSSLTLFPFSFPLELLHPRLIILKSRAAVISLHTATH